MKLIRNLFFLFTITIFGLASTILTIFNYDPYTANKANLTSFYASSFASILGVVSIVIFFIKTKGKKSETVFHHFWPSVRQGFFVSLLTTTLLFLQSIRILDWMIGISLTIVAVLLELFFETKKIKAKA